MSWKKYLLLLAISTCAISGCRPDPNDALAQDTKDVVQKETLKETLKETPKEIQTEENADTSGQDQQDEQHQQDQQVEQFESFDQFQESRTAAMRDYSARYRAAKTREAKAAVAKTRPTLDPYLGQLEKFIREGSAEEADKVAKWWMHGDRAKRDGQRILDALVEAHADSEIFTKYVPRANYLLTSEKAEALHRTLLEKNNFDSVKASATYSLQALLNKQVKTLEGKDAETMTAEIESLRETLMKQYPEAVDSSGITFVARVKARMYARNLDIGKMVPDIVGSDLDGVEFKLSDYKGKVVLLDFWGDW